MSIEHRSVSCAGTMPVGQEAFLGRSKVLLLPKALGPKAKLTPFTTLPKQSFFCFQCVYNTKLKGF